MADATLPPGSKLVLDRHDGRVRWRVRLPDTPVRPERQRAIPVARFGSTTPLWLADDALDDMVAMVVEFVQYRFGDSATIREPDLRGELETYALATSDPEGARR